MNLYLQQIFVEWTVEEGQQPSLEEQREQIAAAYPIPWHDASWTRVHDVVRCLGSAGYQPRRLVRELESRSQVGRDHLTLGAALLNLTPSLMLVDFIYSQDLVGDPPRETRHALRLPAGEWGRIAYEGYFPAPDARSSACFRRQTLNLYWGDSRPAPRLFVDGEPFQSFSATFTQLAEPFVPPPPPPTPTPPSPPPVEEPPASLPETNGEADRNGSGDELDFGTS